mmetsp:Transcript_2621/g.6032  ORF Transcript_2621/g.6032 Transcript_2621/m.6032 type:complete len:248 (+) Transcript_2621:1750-2493(+)
MCQPACAVSGRDALEANPQKHKGSEEEGVHGHGHGSSDGGVDEVDNLVGHPGDPALERCADVALGGGGDEGGDEAEQHAHRRDLACEHPKQRQDQAPDDACEGSFEADSSFSSRLDALQGGDEVGSLAVSLANLRGEGVGKLCRKRGHEPKLKESGIPRRESGKQRTNGSCCSRSPHVLGSSPPSSPLCDARRFLLRHFEFRDPRSSCEIESTGGPASRTQRAPENHSQNPRVKQTSGGQHLLVLLG